MKISELIENLQSLKDTHGDLYTVCVDIHGGSDPVSEVYVDKTDIRNKKTGEYEFNIDVVWLYC